MKKTIITIIFAVVLISSGVALGIFLTKRNSTPTALVLFSINKEQNTNNNITEQNNLKIEDVNSTNNNLNLSIEILFSINAQNKVLFAIYPNNQTKDLFKINNFDGKVLGETISKIMSIAKNNGYLDDRNNMIDFGIYTNNIKLAENIKSGATKRINKIVDDGNFNFKIKYDIYLQTTNLLQKYADIATKLQLNATDFKDKTETEILQYFNYKSAEHK